MDIGVQLFASNIKLLDVLYLLDENNVSFLTVYQGLRLVLLPGWINCAEAICFCVD